MSKVRLKQVKQGSKIKFTRRGEIWVVIQNTPTYTPPYSPESITIILRNKAGEERFGDPNRKVYCV